MLDELCKSKYIIFDFDGVIVDSEIIYFKAWKSAAYLYGFNLTDEELLSLRSCDKSIACKLFGGLDQYNVVREKRKEIMNDYLVKNKFKLKDGIYDSFKNLYNRGYIIVIATSSSLNMVDSHLKYYKLDKYVKEILSVKPLKRGKPYPDIYLNVCEHFNLKPNEVLAVEDSPNGILSAYYAGVNVAMIPDLTMPDKDILNMVCGVYSSVLELVE